MFDRDFSNVIIYRAFSYVLVAALLAIYSSNLFFEENPIKLSFIFMIMSGLSFLQFLFWFKRESQWSLFFLFLADSALSMLIIKGTGGSASPFLVLFPVISLAGAILFKIRVLPWVLMGACTFMMTFAVGFGPSIVGNAMAIIGTCVLGYYLSMALEKTDQALSRVQLEKKRLQNLQKAIMANIPSGLMSVNSTGKIIQVNNIALTILGKGSSDVLGYHLYEFLPELDRLRSHLETVTSINDSFEPIKDRKTINFKRDDGTSVILGYSLARLSDPDDLSPIGTLIVFQDLTEIMQMEKSLRLSEKLAAVGELAAGIAHEIRNPLAGISGGAQLLQGAEGLDEEDKKLLDIIQKESTRLDHLITEFLEYVKPKEAKREAVDLEKASYRVLELLKFNPKWQQLNCQASVQTHGMNNQRALGDEDKIIQIFLNFVLNAGQAGAKNVLIEIIDGIQVQIKDDGPGIPKEHQDRIFEPFFTTKDTGTGLGLAISYRALESMSATIKLDSPALDFAPEKGTIFSIDFKGAA